MPAVWGVGPPPPRLFTHLTRLLQLVCLLLMVLWVTLHLGGLRLSPQPTGPDTNDTGALFNWHPLLLALAFPVLMGEALLSYKAPLLALPDRCEGGACAALRVLAHCWERRTIERSHMHAPCCPY